MRKSKDYYNQFNKHFFEQKLITENKPINHLCKEFCITKEFVRKKCREFNVSTTQHALLTKNVTKEDLTRLHFEEKKTKKQIAQIYNASKRTVSQWFRKYHITGQDNRKEQNKIKRLHTITENQLANDYIVNGLLKHEIQKKYGIGQEYLNDFFAKYKIPLIHSRSTSSGECELSDWITSLGSQVIKNDKKIIAPQELDIVILNKNLAIEYNGIYYHNSRSIDKNYHLNKTKKCEEKNIQLIHIFDSEWLNKKDIWKSIIRSKLGLIEKIYARKCTVGIENDVKIFCEENHLSGQCNAKVKVGLRLNNELVSVMTFSRSRFNKNYEWEIIRLCSKLNHQIIGGASKMLKFFIETYQPKSIITYANRRYSNGNVYSKLGFTFKGNTEPNYFYCCGSKILSRLNFQKHKLKNQLDKYNENLTEEQNMQNNGYYRIYDCGNAVYELILNK